MIAHVLASVLVLAQQQTPVPKLKLVQDMRIDGATNDISSISGVVVGAGGRIAFFETQDSRVRIFDANGKEVAKFGRRGEGPGEFGFGLSDAIPIGRGASKPDVRLGTLADTFWAFNARRFTVFTRDGRFVRTVGQPAFDRDAIVRYEPQALLLGSNMLSLARSSPDAGAARTRGASASQASYVVITKNGDVTSTLAHMPFQANFVKVARCGSAVPFVEGTYQSVASDGSRIAIGTTTIASARAGQLRISVIGNGGDTLLSRDVAFAPVTVSSHSADSAVAERTRSVRTCPSVGELERRLRSAIPKQASAYRSLTLATDHSIWVAGTLSAKGRDYLILDERGIALGTVTLASNMSLRAATRSMVWVTETDANELPSIVRYRITK